MKKKAKTGKDAAQPDNRQSSGSRKLRSGLDPSIGRATQFKPGECPNPGGRPKTDEAAEIARAIFENNAEAVYKAMLKALKKGNPKVFAALADRGYGKVPQHLTLGDSENQGIDLTVRFVKSKHEC